MKVLVADDTPENLQILYKTLKNEGYELALVKNGEECLKQASDFSPHLILLDIVMPGVNGFEVCERIKKNKDTKDISIIFLSAKMYSEDIVRGFEVGASDYITKPFEQAEVLARVKNHLMLQQLHLENAHYITELERSNIELESFAHVVSHDLQAPLRKIVTFSDRFMNNTKEFAQENRTDLTIVKNSAIRMKIFIEDLLKFSELKKIKSQYPLINLGETMDEVLSDINHLVVENGATINIDELPTLEAVPHQMHQLFQNLFSNSLKYRKKGVSPVINLKCSSDGNGGWELNIIDNGIGFEDKHANRIFKPFERLHGINEYEGTGIGLAICEKIVKLHHGNIQVKSIKNEGTTFTIFLPKNQPLNH